MSRQFEHDCNACVFLGHVDKHDLYFCPNDILGPTVIARWSSEGPDYSSGLCFICCNPLLHEAAKRAVQRGLLDPNAKTGGMGQGNVGEELAANFY